MLDILFVTDYVCPYCILAKEALRRALDKLYLDAKITYQPLLLKPKPPVQFNPDDPAVKKRFALLSSAAKALDIDMKIPVNISPRPVTRLAFEGWHYALEQGKGDEYADLMYRAYFVEEKNIGEIEVLRELAERIGLNGEEYVKAVESGKYTETVLAKDNASRNELKVRGVPTIYIGGQQIELNDYTVEEMVNILNGLESVSGGMHCGDDGCAPADSAPACGKDGCK